MQRVTITIDDELVAEVDRFMAARGYANRSEAIRDLARSGLQQAATEVGGARQCVAALVYVYDHETRELPKRLTRNFHERHDLAETTLHVHLDHDAVLKSQYLRGVALTCRNSPITSSLSAECAMAAWSICLRMRRTRTAEVRPIAIATTRVTDGGHDRRFGLASHAPN